MHVGNMPTLQLKNNCKHHAYGKEDRVHVPDGSRSVETKGDMEGGGARMANGRVERSNWLKIRKKQKKTNTHRRSVKIREKSGFWVWGVWGAISTVNLFERAAQKLRRIILTNFASISFRFDFGKTREPARFMFCEFSDVSMTPKTKLWIRQLPPNH